MNLRSLSGDIKQSQGQAVSDARAIGEKGRMVRDYQRAATARATPVPTPSGPPAKGFGVNRGRFGSQPGEQRLDVDKMRKPLGSFKKGGKVKKTGIYKLHAKERVLNPKQTKKFEAKGGLAKVLAGK